mgnify:FL=1
MQRNSLTCSEQNKNSISKTNSTEMDTKMLSYNKLCELEDFTHPKLQPIISSIFLNGKNGLSQGFPNGQEYRKHWEIAMSVRALADGGAIHPKSKLLGVGAGNEPTSFYLTNHVDQVFATDLYVDENWHQSANLGMFTHPERYWNRDWNRRRLIVQHMDARELHYESNSFDGIFSSSSLEHFGSLKDVRQSIKEMTRVLKPGGILTLSTEFRLEGSGNGLSGTLLFDESQIRELFFNSSHLEPMSAPEFQISSETLQTELPYEEAVKDVLSHIQTHGEIIYHKLIWSSYPHILLRQDQYLFTSIHIALRKPKKSK